MKYFQLTELVHSDTAIAKRVDNSPTWQVAEHLSELTEKILDPLRESWGSGLRITSGYRCKELNSLVGGSATSAHTTGFAADIQPVNGKIEQFIEFAIKWAKDNNVAFDQIIDEKDKKGNHWCHIGLYNLKGEQRRETKKMIKA